jgi:hypothetical protein
MKVVRSLLVAAAALVTTVAASAQSFNINFGSTATLTLPNTYGAAAGLGGTGSWNQITNPAVVNAPLVGLNGAAIGATLSLDGGTMFNFINSAPNGTTTPAGSNAERLLDSLWDPGAGNPAGNITINNLAAGMYDIYTYGVAPDGNADRTTITIGGNQQVVQGQLPNPFTDNDYAVGLTHAFHQINHAGGSLVISIGVGPGGFASVNGIQFVIPGPGALALLGLAGLVGPRRRRN